MACRRYEAFTTQRATGISLGVSGQTNLVMPSAEIDPAPPGQRDMYRCSVLTRSQRGSLIDRGANGGILGNDARVIYTHPFREVDVTGIDNHELTALKIVDAIGKVTTQMGPAIVVMRQCDSTPTTAYNVLFTLVHRLNTIAIWSMIAPSHLEVLSTFALTVVTSCLWTSLMLWHTSL